MEKICVYTCITGDYDNLKEVTNPEPNIDYICFTNNKKIKSKTWNIKYISDDSLSNVQLARKIKILGDPALKKYNITLWIDGDVVFVTPIRDFIKTYVDLNTFDLVGFKHHARNTAQEEIEACFEHKKAPFSDLCAISNFLKKNQYPDKNGLVESTLLFRNFNNKKLLSCMKIWFDCVLKYSHRDQLSFGYAQFKTGILVNMLDINIWNNEYFKTTKHISNYDISIGFVEENKEFNFNNLVFKEYKLTDKEIDFIVDPKVDCNMIKLYFISDHALKIHPQMTEAYEIGGSAVKILDGIIFNVRPIPHFLIKNNFVKGKRYHFKFKVKALDEAELLSEMNNNTISEIAKITDSKYWKICEKVRKFIPLK